MTSKMYDVDNLCLKFNQVSIFMLIPVKINKKFN